MNKRIKKKLEKLHILSMGFSEEDYRFIQKYPRLYSICSVNNISKKKIDKLYNYVKFTYTKDEFEIYYRIYLVNPNARRIIEFRMMIEEVE